VRGVENAGAPEECFGMARQAAERRRPRRRKGEDIAGAPQLRSQSAEILRGLVDLPLAGHHEEQRTLGEEERI